MAARVVTAKQTAKTTSTRKAPVKKVVVRKSASSFVKAPMVAGTTINAYIPDPAVSKQYIGRKVLGGIWDLVMLDTAKDNHENVLLAGDTGSGKTLLGEAYASKNSLMYYSLPCDVSIDPSSLFGKMTVTDVVGKYEWQDGPVTQIVRHGGVLNISEVNMMPPRIAAALYSLLDHRRYLALLGHKGEVVRAHIGTKAKDKNGQAEVCWCGESCDEKVLLIIADMNPNYRGTMELNAAFKNRWAHKIPFGYSDEVESQLLQFPTLREIAKKCRALSGIEIMTPVSTNLLMEFEQFARRESLGLDYAIANFVAAFATDEQQPIQKVMDLHTPNLIEDLNFVSGKKATATDDELEEIDFDFVMED